MNVASWLKQAKSRIDTLDAELILLKLLHENDRSFLVSHDTMELSLNDIDVLDKLVAYREAKMPLAYVIGEKDFYGRKFDVDRNVLVPRIESETIIDLSLKLFHDKKIPSKPKILDVGTGSGCIAVTLSLEIPSADVTAVDISEDALKVAMENNLNLDGKVRFIKSDLLDRVNNEKFDLIVANLPYVDDNWDFLSPELEWEPSLALYADNKGLDIIFSLIDQVLEYKCTKYLIIECDLCQQKMLNEYVAKKGLTIVETSGYQTLIQL